MKKKLTNILILTTVILLISFNVVIALTNNANTSNLQQENIDIQSNDISQKFQEKILKEYQGEKEKLFDNTSKKLLQYLDISVTDIQKVNVVQKNNDIFNTLEIDNYKINVDNSGKITKFSNYNDYSTEGKNKRDYGENEILPEVNYIYKDKESVQPIIDELKQTLELTNYEMIDFNDSIEGTWNIIWKGYTNDGLLNPCDTVIVTVDARDGSIMEFNRKKYELNENIQKISSEQARNSINTIIEEHNLKGEITEELTVVIPNEYWKTYEFDVDANYARIAWVFNIDKYYIYVDAETGQVIGGRDEIALADGARVMFTDPNGDGAENKKNSADSAFRRLGYYYPSGCTPWLGYVNQTDMNWIFSHPNLYGLYINSHGGYTRGDRRYYLTGYTNSTETEDWIIYGDEVSGNWHFVILDACGSSLNLDFANSMHIEGYAGRCLVGWNNTIAQIISTMFFERFLPRLGSGSIISLVLSCRDEVNSTSGLAGEQFAPGTCNPGVIGDGNYYGWAW